MPTNRYARSEWLVSAKPDQPEPDQYRWDGHGHLAAVLKAMAVSITICNLALGEIRAPTIAEIGEDSIGVANCGLFYPQRLKLLLERHDWSFATKIVALAELVANPRASEWIHAYACRPIAPRPSGSCRS